MDLTPILDSADFAELSKFRTVHELEIDIPRGAASFLIAQLLRTENTASRNTIGENAKADFKADGDSAASSFAQTLQVVVTASEYEAEELAVLLKNFIPESGIAVFPAWETLPHERLSPRADTVARRLQILRRLAHPEEFAPLYVLLMPVRALLQPIAANLGQLQPVRLAVGDFCDLQELQGALTNAAYTRVDMVESRGEFAVRGGIIDIFPPTEQHPVRVEFLATK
ncbi:hypothetical protein RQN30_09630 [Arcanobacterium hippocoleae]